MHRWSVVEALPLELPEPIEPDRGGYTVTMREEFNAESVLEQLAGGTGPAVGAERLHAGWGSFRNLDIAAARRSTAVLLLDINRHQFRVWDAVRTALSEPGCASAPHFVEAVQAHLPTTPRLRQFIDNTREWLSSEFTRPGSWLNVGQPSRMQWIAELFRSGRVVTACLDVRDGAASFAALGRSLQSAQARGDVHLDTLYVSNLPWMMAQPEGFFGEPNIAPDGDTGAVLRRVRLNLTQLAPHFLHVISAARLAPNATEGNLRWHTECLTSAAFGSDTYWATLKPWEGPYRSLR